MKRSEMLDHIKEDLLEKLKHRWLERGETDKWAEFTANQLLDMIEGFGMLPPETKALPQDFVNLGFTQEFLDEHEFKVNRWEPEDD